MQRIVITGPESSGKTTLAKNLAAKFNVPYVPEYARLYLAAKENGYQLSDIVNIAIGQHALVDSIAASNAEKPFLIIDTWMLELRIWAEYRFGEIPDTIDRMFVSYPPDLYLLCEPDIPWKPDPLRENPYDRDRLFELYRDAVVMSKVPFALIAGLDREAQATDAVKDLQM